MVSHLPGTFAQSFLFFTVICACSFSLLRQYTRNWWKIKARRVREGFGERQNKNNSPKLDDCILGGAFSLVRMVIVFSHKFSLACVPSERGGKGTSNTHTHIWPRTWLVFRFPYVKNHCVFLVCLLVSMCSQLRSSESKRMMFFLTPRDLLACCFDDVRRKVTGVYLLTEALLLLSCP